MKNNLKIKFWGIRGSIPVINTKQTKYAGNTSCIQITAQNGTDIIFDGGSGIVNLSQHYLKNGIPENINIFITHSHWDHIQGLPFFVPAYIPSNNINFYGCNSGNSLFENNIINQMTQPYFPIEVENWQANIKFKTISEEKITINDIEIESIYAEHPGMTLGYKLTYNNKSVVYLPDNELFANFPKDKVYSEEKLDEDDLDMESVFIEEQKNKIFNFLNNVDILIHDSQYTPEEYTSKIGWGHSSYEDTVRTAILSNVKKLILFHHDPSHSDEQIENIEKESQKIAKNKNSNIEIVAAHSNMELFL